MPCLSVTSHVERRSLSKDAKALNGRDPLPSIPNEVMLCIIERCDVNTMLKFRLVCKNTEDIISTFEKQIAIAVAEQMLPEYKDKVAVQSIMPEGMTLLKRVRRVPVVQSICDRLVEISHKGSLLSPLSARPPIGDETKKLFYNHLENGCNIAWQLSDIYNAVKLSLDSNAGIRQTTYQRRLCDEVMKAQLAMIQSTPATDLVDYRVLYMLRSSFIYGWHFGMGQTFERVARSRDRQRGVNGDQNSGLAARRWGAWCSVNRVCPNRMLQYYDEMAAAAAAASPLPTSFPSNSGIPRSPRSVGYETQKFLASIVRDIAQFVSTPVSLADMQRNSAKCVLDAIDKEVSRADTRPSASFGQAFKDMYLDAALSNVWKRRMYGLDCMCFGAE